MVARFCGRAIVRFEAGKVTHVGMETRRLWRYNDLPGGDAGEVNVEVSCGAHRADTE